MQSPLPILWAMTAGLPIIAEQGGVMAWRDGENALLIPPGNINAAADRMTRLHNDRDLRSRLASGAREEIDRVYRLDRFVAVLEQSWDIAWSSRA
jgi:glycosyltransferase involved in cell wall biosynthesis